MKNSWLVVGAALALSPISLLAQSSTLAVPIGDGHRLVLSRPSAWAFAISGPRIGPTVRLSPSGAGSFTILMTALPLRKGPRQDDQEFAAAVRKEGEALLRTSLQAKVELTRVQGSGAFGYVYHLTDQAPEKGPDDYREMHRAIIAAGPYDVSVTILTHSDDVTTVPEAMKMLSSIVYEP